MVECVDVSGVQNDLIEALVKQIQAQGKFGIGTGTRLERAKKYWDDVTKKKQKEKEKFEDRAARAAAGEELEDPFPEMSKPERFARWLALTPSVLLEIGFGKRLEKGKKTERARRKTQETFEKKVLSTVERSRLRAKEAVNNVEELMDETLDKTLAHFDESEKTETTGKIAFWARKLSSINVHDIFAKNASLVEARKRDRLLAMQQGEDSKKLSKKEKAQESFDSMMHWFWQGFGISSKLAEKLSVGPRSEKAIRKVGEFGRWAATKNLDARVVTAAILIGQGGMTLAMPAAMSTSLAILGTGIGAKVAADRLGDIFGHFMKRNDRKEVLTNVEDVQAMAEEYGVALQKDTRLELEAAMDKNPHNQKDPVFRLLDLLQKKMDSHFKLMEEERLGWLKRDDFDEFVQKEIDTLVSEAAKEYQNEIAEEESAIDINEGTPFEIKQKKKRLAEISDIRSSVIAPGTGFDISMQGIKDRLAKKLFAMTEEGVPTIHIEHIKWEIADAKREIDWEETELTKLCERLRKVRRVYKKIEAQLESIQEPLDDMEKTYRTLVVLEEMIHEMIDDLLKSVLAELDDLISERRLAKKDARLEARIKEYDGYREKLENYMTQFAKEEEAAEETEDTQSDDAEEVEGQDAADTQSDEADEGEAQEEAEDEDASSIPTEAEVQKKVEVVKRRIDMFADMITSMRKEESRLEAIQERLEIIEMQIKGDMVPLIELYKEKAQLERERKNIEQAIEDYRKDQILSSDVLTGTPNKRYERIHAKIDAIVAHEIVHGDVNSLEHNRFYQELKRMAKELAFDAFVDRQSQKLTKSLKEGLRSNQLPVDFSENSEKRDAVFGALFAGDSYRAAQLMDKWVTESQGVEKGKVKGALDATKDTIRQKRGKEAAPLFTGGVDGWEKLLLSLDFVKTEGGISKDDRKRIVGDIMKHHESHMKKRAEMVDQKRFTNAVRRWGAVAGAVPLAQIIGPYTEALHTWATKVPELFHDTGDVAKWVADLGDLAVDGWTNWEMFGDNPPYEFYKPLRPIAENLFTASTPLEAGVKTGMAVAGTRGLLIPGIATGIRAVHKGLNHIAFGPMSPLRKLFGMK